MAFFEKGWTNLNLYQKCISVGKKVFFWAIIWGNKLFRSLPFWKTKMAFLFGFVCTYLFNKVKHFPIGLLFVCICYFENCLFIPLCIFYWIISVPRTLSSNRLYIPIQKLLTTIYLVDHKHRKGFKNIEKKKNFFKKKNYIFSTLSKLNHRFLMQIIKVSLSREQKILFLLEIQI